MRKTQKQEAIQWWNSIGRTLRTELSNDYFGSELILDDEIIHIFLKLNPPEKTYTRKEFERLIRKYEKDNLYYGRDAYYNNVDIASEWLKLNQ